MDTTSSLPSQSSLFERLGGHIAIEAAVVRFYEKVMADPGLAAFFEGMDMGAQIHKMIAFLTIALGGPHSYTGRDLRTAHARPVRQGLNTGHFGHIARLLTETLVELEIERSLIDEVLQIVASTHDDVLNK